MDAPLRARWLADAELRERTATAPRSIRFDWGDDGSRVHVTVDAKGVGRSVVSVQHERLPDAGAQRAHEGVLARAAGGAEGAARAIGQRCPDLWTGCPCRPGCGPEMIAA